MPAMVVQSRAFNDPAGYGARFLTFDQFDPAKGALGGVRVEVSATVNGRLSVENMEGRAVSLTYGANALVSVFAPGGALLDEQAVAGEQTVTLAAFDGGVDFAGASGTLLDVTAAVDGVAGATPGGVVDAAPFLGTGTVALPVGDYATNRIAGPANMRVQAAASVGGEVRLAYDYTPKPIDDGGGGGEVIVPPTPFPGFGATVTVTGPPQVFSFDPRATGWQETLPVARFDPALGTLLAVQVRLVSTVAASASVENHGAAAGRAEVSQFATTTLARGTVGITDSSATVDRVLSFGAADGVDDFAGSGGVGEAGWNMTKAQAVTLGDAASRAAFTGSGSQELVLDSQGSGVVTGPASFLAEITALSGAVVEVAYTYAVDAAAAAVVVADGTSETSTVVAAEAYAGPVSDLQHQFISITPDNLVIAATTDNWFIRTGNGTDAIAARGGTNVIDGGGGSNFLTGGFGRDTFFVDLRDAAADVWSTVANFQSGDEVTLWGVTSEAATLSWRDGAGAAGATGLTLHASMPGRPTGSLTLAGYDTGDLTNGRLVASFGTVGGSDYMFVRAS
ncbi:MAG: choice-of-anchor E domain-containing protein [Acetobacteraceae bacterium]|nr:choice-of-anchor E domain-containing protein [Acetobacteraceae bacterium]